MNRIVLTGGPSSGKSSSLVEIEEKLSERGYKVFIVEESATSMVQMGISPGNHIDMLKFQDFILENQLNNEKLINDACEFYKNNKIVIIYDRGIMDGMAYIGKDNFEKLLAENGLSKEKVFSRYDGVIHLVTAAKNFPDSYSFENKARRENIKEAIEADDRVLKSWVGHPHLRIIEGQPTFEKKIECVLNEIYNILGEPQPKEIERKLLIKKPSDEDLNSLDVVNRSSIIQTYLLSGNNEVERRVRQRGTDGDYSYFYTEKRETGNIGERIETEKKITIKEYVSYMADTDFSKHQIVKTRYCFIYKNQYFELDIYPFDNEKAILEIELGDINDKFELPEFIEVIKDVTDDKRYKNNHIAKDLKLGD